MLSPAYLRDAADPVVAVFARVEQDIMSDIARRIVKTDMFTETAQYQLEKAQQIGLLQGDVKKVLASATGKSQKEVMQIMKSAGVESLKFDDAIYRKAGLKPTPIEKSPVVKAMLLQGVDKTNALIGNFTKTAAITSTRAFSSALDRCYLQILSGAFDRNTAIKLAVKDLASKGIEKVAYPSGAVTSMDAAVRRAVTTGLNQSVSRLQLARAEDMGCELVETTSHAGARPTHAEWQGKVFCIKGHHKSYGDFYRETGYGEGDGLCGWNCYHSFFPYFEGLSIKAFDRDPSKQNVHENDEDYKLQQRQRTLERRIRQSKQECVVLDAAIKECDSEELYKELYEEFKTASSKLVDRERALHNFIAETQRTRLNDREWTPNFTAKIASKVEKANARKKNYVDWLTLEKKGDTIDVDAFKKLVRDGRVNRDITSDQKKHSDVMVWAEQTRLAIKNNDSIKSRLYRTADAQYIIDKFGGTGKMRAHAKNLCVDEFVTLPFPAGVVFDKKVGKFIESNVVQIKWAQKGAHVFPALP